MIESRAPINEMDSYQKTDKKTNKNYETNNNPSEFSKREEVLYYYYIFKQLNFFKRITQIIL